MEESEQLDGYCDELLEQIDLEIHDFPTGVRPKYTIRLQVKFNLCIFLIALRIFS